MTGEHDDVAADEVAIEFEYSQAEFMRAARLQLRRQFRLDLLLSSGSLFVLLGIGLVLSGSGRTSPGIAILLLGAFEAGYAGLFLWRIPRRTWKRSATRSGLVSMIFSERGVRTHTTASDATAPWSQFNALKEVRDFYALRRVHSRASLIFPKRSLASGEQDRQFREIVRRQMPIAPGRRRR